LFKVKSLLKDIKMIEVVLTPAAGKRLIGKAVAVHPAIQERLKSGIVAIVAGTTNGYVAEEILKVTGQLENFSRKSFFRGITLTPSSPTDETGRLKGNEFPGDVIIVNGRWEKRKTIFDVIDRMNEGDIVIKGANAVDIKNNKAGILIGHPKAGTIGTIIQAVAGRRVRLIIPVGLEKRVCGDIDNLAVKVNSPGADGPRLMSVNGEIITEIEAISILTGARAELFAAGGVGGAEGAVWLAISGNEAQLVRTKEIINSVSCEQPFCV